MLSKEAKKYHMKTYVGLEARLETTKHSESKAPLGDWNYICRDEKCPDESNNFIISTKPIPIGDWEKAYGSHWSILTLTPDIKEKAGKIGTYNLKLYLKAWLVPEHLIKGDALGEVDRETLAASATLYTYPIKLSHIPYSVYKSKSYGNWDGGFDGVAYNKYLDMPNPGNGEYIFYTLNEEGTAYEKSSEIDLNPAYKADYCRR